MQSLLVNQPAYSKISLWVVTFLMATQCTSSSFKGGVTSDELRRPLNDIRRACYYALKNKVKSKSENNRTLFSDYHRPGLDPRLKAYKTKERGQALITVIGDRRPYRVVVVYRVERREGSDYVFDRFDKGLAEQYLAKVEKYLASRPEDRDIIDDFRAF